MNTLTNQLTTLKLSGVKAALLQQLEQPNLYIWNKASKSD